MKESTLAASSRLGGAVISDRVVTSLLDELRTGRYAHADRLPAEVDLAAELGVSRTVIRDALSEMERAGYVERVRGIGTVVNRSVLGLRSRLDQKLEYYPLIRSFGSYPHADGIQVFPIRAGDELAHNLDIEPGDEVICIKKRILADTTPVIYSIDYLPRSLFGNRDYTRIDLTGGVFDILERSLRDTIKMLPGIGSKIKDEDIDEGAFNRFRSIIYSMTVEERTKPEIINPSRKRRIAAGSGTDVPRVNRVLKQYKQMKEMMKMLGGKGKNGKRRRRMPFNPAMLKNLPPM